MHVPNLVGFVLFLLVPLVLAFYLSFTNSDANQDTEFVGLNNYAEMFSIDLRWKGDVQADDQGVLTSGYTPLGSIMIGGRALVIGARDALFWVSLRNTLVLCLLLIPLSVIPALELALLLNSRLPGVKIFRAIYGLPAVVAMVGAAQIWRGLYDPIFGLINGLITQTAGLLGISDPEVQWLNGPSVMLLTLALLVAWQSIGFNTVIILAGLHRIPYTLYEAAQIDGAGRWGLLRWIMLPMLRPIMLFVTITTFVSGLQVFDQPYTLFNSEPIPENVSTLTTYLYQRGLLDGESGYGSAIGCILGLMVFTVNIVRYRIWRSAVHEVEGDVTAPVSRWKPASGQWFPRLAAYAILTSAVFIMLFPFVYMLLTSLKDSNDVLRFPPRLLPYTTRTIEYDGRTTPVYLLSVDGIERGMVSTGNRTLTPRGFEDEFVDPDNPEIMAFAAVQSATIAEYLQFRFDNYPTVIEMGLGRALVNTALVTVGVVIGQLITSVLGGYAFSRMRFRGRDMLFLIYLGAAMIPLVAYIIPLHRLTALVGWDNQLISLVIPWMFSAYGTFLMRQFFLTIPREIEEAAILDGAGQLNLLWNIFIPLSRAALVTLGFLAFLSTWNSFLWPLVMVGEANTTNHVLTLALIHLREVAAHQPNLVLAGVAIAITPPIILFLLTQKYFMANIANLNRKG